VRAGPRRGTRAANADPRWSDRVAIDIAEVQRIAALAQLALDERELAPLRDQLQAILDHVALLERLDAGASSPETAEASRLPRLREDEIRTGLSQAEALGNAPDTRAGFLRVPRVIPG
jgi:aspartyl-tRNA(Asn)/glutamyl-tRNA(Gln) amidotransferase subunit C